MFQRLLASFGMLLLAGTFIAVNYTFGYKFFHKIYFNDEIKDGIMDHVMLFLFGTFILWGAMFIIILIIGFLVAWIRWTVNGKWKYFG